MHVSAWFARRTPANLGRQPDQRLADRTHERDLWFTVRLNGLTTVVTPLWFPNGRRHPSIRRRNADNGSGKTLGTSAGPARRGQADGSYATGAP